MIKLYLVVSLTLAFSSALWAQEEEDYFGDPPPEFSPSGIPAPPIDIPPPGSPTSGFPPQNEPPPSDYNSPPPPSYSPPTPSYSPPARTGGMSAGFNMDTGTVEFKLSGERADTTPKRGTARSRFEQRMLLRRQKGEF